MNIEERRAVEDALWHLNNDYAIGARAVLLALLSRSTPVRGSVPPMAPWRRGGVS